MPRQNTPGEILQTLSSIELYTEPATPVTAATTGAIAALAAVAPFGTTPTGFASGDPVYFVGTGGPELNAVGGVPAASLPLTYKAAAAQAIGAVMHKMVKQDLGYIEQSGLKAHVQLSQNPIMAANYRAPVGYTRGPGELSGSLALYGVNLENLALFFGIDSAQISGAGTSTDPWQLAVSGLTLASHGLMAFRAKGVRDDLVNVWQDFNGVTITPNGDISITNQGPTTVPVTFRYLNSVIREW